MNIGAVVTAAGLGSRNGPWTLLFPKALLPLVVKVNGTFSIRPMLDLIIAALTRTGCSKICVVRRSGDEAIVRYTKALWGNVNVEFTTQDEPRGFGDAVYRGLSCLNDVDWVIVHADDGVMVNESSALSRAIKLVNEANADGVVFVRRVSNPSRYGVLQEFVKEGDGIYRVIDVEEKPKAPKSNLALTAVYVFKRGVLSEFLGKIENDRDKLVIEFTDFIRLAVNNNVRVLALEINPEVWLSIGTPLEYHNVQGIVHGVDMFELI